MAKPRRNVPIASWAAGDTVSGFALLSRKERRQDKNGNDFLDLELADASGSITGRVWADSPALDGDYDGHDFVAFKGAVKSYRDSLQISVTECRRAVEGDREYGFDPGLLVPTSRIDLDELWRRLTAIYPEAIASKPLARLARETLEVYGPRLKVHPAAKSIHHAWRGGLLEHVVSMAELAVRVAAHYEELDGDLLLVGVLFHDLGKLQELGEMPRNDYTPEGRLVGHVVLGRDLLRERAAAIEGFPDEVRLELEHLVLSHQGQLAYGAPVEPMTPEAIALHAIDNLDAQLAQLRQAGETAEGFQYLRAFGRMVRLRESPPPSPEPESPAAEEPAPVRPADARRAPRDDADAATEADPPAQPGLDL